MKRLIAIVLLAAMLFGCTAHPYQSTGAFYYLRTIPDYSSSDGIIASEDRVLPTELLEMVDLYCAGPKDPALNAPLPPDCQVLQAQIDEDVLVLHFDARLGQLSGIHLTLAASCLARTFLPLTDTTELVLSAKDSRLNGQSSVRLRLEELELQDNSLDLLHETFTLYYSDPDRRYLIAQEVAVNLALEDDAKLYLLRRLQSAPEGLRSALPAATDILSVATDGGTCTVALSTEFLKNRFHSPRAQLLSLMSMVNTLTKLEDVERVEFTVEDELLVRYGSITISEPLRKDGRLIGPVREGLGEFDGVLYLLHGEKDLLCAMPTRLRTYDSHARSVMEALLADSGTNGFHTGIDPDTKLLGLSMEHGVCTVDLSGEYLRAGERLQFCNLVIAASLLQVDVISEVQITVNGAVPEGFAEDFFHFSNVNADCFL